ncbi:MAG: glycosyl hydrolase, partial [Chloroflexota bacterium]
AGLNIRRGRGTEYDKVGFMEPTHTASPLEMHGITIRKTQTAAEENQWINVDTSEGVTGFAAGWFLEARSPRSVKITNTAFNGINLDVLHPLGKPNPARLNALTYGRFAYSVSMGRGNQDLNAAYNLYAPYITSLNNAGMKPILVYTHQTYGEGAGFIWSRMNSSRWQELAARLADFLRVIARQYRGQVAAHQIWNEQDAPEGAEASVRMSAEDYAHILKVSIEAIRSEDPSTPIITGGHTGGPIAGGNYARATLAAMPSNIRPDGIAAHPYGRGPGGFPKYEIFGDIDETVQEYSQVLPGKRIWLTEWGILNANNEPPADVSAYATAFLNRIQQRHADKVAATIWYAWAEGMHNGYGLVNASDQPREPLYTAYTSIK